MTDGSRDASGEMVIALANLNASLEALIGALPPGCGVSLTPAQRHAHPYPRATAPVERMRLAKALQTGNAAVRLARAAAREDAHVARLVRGVENDLCIAAGVLRALGAPVDALHGMSTPMSDDAPDSSSSPDSSPPDSLGTDTAPDEHPRHNPAALS